MTYCLAMKLTDGLVFLSDSRTNAGVDHIATFRKMYRFSLPGQCAVTLLAAGNLGTTQKVMHQLRHPSDSDHWLESDSIHAMASHIGRVLQHVIAEHSHVEHTDFRANFIFGGQIKDQAHQLFHIYPEGNYISATQETPYFLIGESKYGKPIIDRIIHQDTDLDTAVRCALISMDSTIRSNLSVGLPIDLQRYQKDSLHLNDHADITATHPEFLALRKGWSQAIQQAFDELPRDDFFNLAE